MAFAFAQKATKPATLPAKGARSKKQTAALGQVEPVHSAGRLGFGQSVSASGGAPVIQAKLKIGEPDDQYEKEADRVADEVMRMPEPMATAAGPADTGAPGSGKQPGNGSHTIQRMCTGCAMEEEDKLRRKPVADNALNLPRISALNGPVAARFSLPKQQSVVQRQEMDDEDEMMQMKPAGGGSTVPAVTPGVEAGIHSLSGRGQPLPESTRAFFEPRFGRDFSGVRVHTDAQAAGTAQSVQAKAFTTGRNIVFGAGEYAPESGQGRRLLGHELVHVVQQGGAESGSGSLGRKGGPMGSESFEFVERAYGWQRPRSPSPEGGPPPIQMQMQVDLLGAGTAGAGASPGAAVQRSAEPTASVEAAGASADAEASSATSAATQVELLPANLVFGVVEVGTTAPLGNVQVWNRGAEIVTIQGCVVSGAGFVAELWHVPHLAQIAAPVQLAPGQKIWMSVEFHPVTAGEHVALVSVLMPDGAGATLLAKGSGEQSSLQGSARGGAPRDAGAQPQPAPADTPPVAKAVEPVEHRLEARPKSLDLTTVAGRATLPQPIRLTNPNTVYVSADLSIETDDDHDQVFSITGNGNYRRDAASLHTYVAPREHNLPEEIPITFTPGALGSYQAALHVRYAQFEERVPLSGTALPGRGADSATKESGNAGTSSPDEFAIRTASTPLLEAEKPKSNADARALLLQAADAVSALAPAYQAQVPQMKAVADLFIDECAAAAGAFNKELVHWITTECATALGGMNSNNFKDFLDFLMGRAISLLPKPLDVILGIVYDVVSLGVDIWQVSAQNRVVNTALAQNTYLGGMLAGATSDTTQHVIRVLGRGLESFGEALGALDETAGPGASDQLKDIGKRLEGLDGATALSEAVDCYEAARKFVDRHQENMHQLARALGDLSRAHIMLTSNLPKQLGKLMDRYIEFMSTGGKPHDKPIAISIGGVINYEGSYDRRRSFILYFGSIRFGDASLTGKTESYVGRKRMLDLAGYDVTIVLVSPQGGEVVLRQAADRSRSDEVPSDAERRIEGAGGVAALWASIDEKQLHELLRRSR